MLSTLLAGVVPERAIMKAIDQGDGTVALQDKRSKKFCSGHDVDSLICKVTLFMI